MQSNSYSIGEFSAINKISARMLRHYDKIGLLKPAEILPNGYRTYSSCQIPTIARIKQYQGCGFSLSEIKTLLDATKEQIEQFAKSKMYKFQAQNLADKVTWEQLCSLSGEHPQCFENSYEISFIQQNDRTFLACQQPVPEEKIEAAFDFLQDTMVRVNIKPSGLLTLLSNLEDGAVYYAAVPMKSAVNCEGCHCIVASAGWYLSTMHYGGYETISAGYDRLLCYAKQHKLMIADTFMERYFVDSSFTANTNEYITDISVKIYS